jgi:hypothetical protein
MKERVRFTKLERKAVLNLLGCAMQAYSPNEATETLSVSTLRLECEVGIATRGE